MREGPEAFQPQIGTNCGNNIYGSDFREVSSPVGKSLTSVIIEA